MFVTTIQQLIVELVLPMAGVGTAEGDCPFLKTATVPEGERAITVRSGEVEEQPTPLQMENIIGSITAPRLSVATACPRWLKRIVTG